MSLCVVEKFLRFTFRDLVLFCLSQRRAMRKKRPICIPEMFQYNIETIKTAIHVGSVLQF